MKRKYFLLLALPLLLVTSCNNNQDDDKKQHHRDNEGKAGRKNNRDRNLRARGHKPCHLLRALQRPHRRAAEHRERAHRRHIQPDAAGNRGYGYGFAGFADGHSRIYQGERRHLPRAALRLRGHELSK